MKASQRKKDPLSHRNMVTGHSERKTKEKKEDVAHRLLTGLRKNVGDVGAEDVAALNTIASQQLKYEGVNHTPGDVIDVTRAVMSDSGADPTRAMQELKKKKK